VYHWGGVCAQAGVIADRKWGNNKGERGR
jgi:hypothetical protein